MAFISQPHLSRDAPDYRVGEWRRFGAPGRWYTWKANKNKTRTGCGLRRALKLFEERIFLLEKV
jgi:hypothetical protein